jgi:hypothetical protein
MLLYLCCPLCDVSQYEYRELRLAFANIETRTNLRHLLVITTRILIRFITSGCIDETKFGLLSLYYWYPSHQPPESVESVTQLFYCE